MAKEVGTHSGTFHADDVLAFALLRTFVDPEATVVRTRDLDRLARADIVIDVGGIYDTEVLRFDHHQCTYQGPLSSAGMILDWLRESETIDDDLACMLRYQLVEYVDAVDTGRMAPKREVPCFARIVEAIGLTADTPEEQDAAFLEAVSIAQLYLKGLIAGHGKVCEARAAVRFAMDDAVAQGRAVLFLDKYYTWKPVYFEFGGEHHPTDFVLFPSEDDTWKVVAIPPTLGQFEQKRSLPIEWAGKMGEELEEATGVPGSLFCHKNRFIAVFQTREGAIEALKRFDLYDVPAVEGVRRGGSTPCIAARSAKGR